MKTRTLSPQTYARLAGLLYLIITIAAGIAHFYVPETLIVAGDAAATFDNIAGNPALLRLGGVGGELIILLSEVLLTVILYVLLKPVSKTLSGLAAVSRLAMTAVHGLNLVNYFFVLQLTGGADYLAVFSPQQQQALVTLFLDAHSYGFTVGIAFLTIHVLVLGWLILKSGYFPAFLGILFIAAGIGYTVDSFAQLLSTGYQTTPIFIALPIMLSEIAFPLWLLVKGVRQERWPAPAPALGTA